MSEWICPECGSVCDLAELLQTVDRRARELSAATSNLGQVHRVIQYCPACGGLREQPPMTGCPAGWHAVTWR